MFSEKAQITVAVLSDDGLFRDGLVRIIDAEPSIVISDYDEQAADVLLLDCRMDGAFSLCATIARTGHPAVIFVAAPDSNEWAIEGLNAGARGILDKTSRTEDLVNAVRFVSGGLIWARRRVMTTRIDRLNAIARIATEPIFEQRLSTREREIFRHAAMGLSTSAVAQRLRIREASVKVHLTHIFQKLGVRDSAELPAAYQGLIPPPALRRDLPVE